MTTKEILEMLDVNSTVLTNATVPMAPFGPVNATALHELNFNAFTSTTSASKPPSVNTSDVVADINATGADIYGGNLTFHNVTSSLSSNLSDAVTASFVQQEISSVPEGSSRVSEILTTEPEYVDSTTANFQSTTQILVDKSSQTIGIAVGVTIAVIVVIFAVVALFFFFRRRRLLRRKQPEAVLENPHYTLDRNSTLPKNFDLTMHTGPMVRSLMNNNSTENLTKTNGKRKKDSAARPPIYKSTGKDSASKRKPIPPPKHLGYEDLYEKDSAAGSTEALELTPVYAINNENAAQEGAESETLHSAPLLESFHPQKKASKRSSKIDAGEPVLSKEKDEEDEDEEMKTALLTKEKTRSNLSLTRKQKTPSQASESSA